jgi:hypothetical protein
MRSCPITALLIVVNSIGATIALSASSNLVGTAAIQHCGSADAGAMNGTWDYELSISCQNDEAIQLRFATPNDQSVLKIDFVLRGKNVPNEHRIVEVFFSPPQRSDHVISRIAFQADGRLHPLASNIDRRGVSKSVLPLEDFVNLAMMSTLEGTAFGEHFIATNQQMLTLRLAVGRWAAYATPPK